MPIETQEEENMKELERKPYSSESLRVRCPHCRKLYLVQFSDILEAKPRFECVQCHDRFWLSMADVDGLGEVSGIPIQIKEPPAPKTKKADGPVKPCPKCFKAVGPGVTECPHCGVLISKVKDLNFIENIPVHSESLGQAWKKVLSHYDDETVHSDFLRIAQRERNLPYAAAQYGQLSKLMPGDETTMKRMTEVQALGSTMLPPPEKKLKVRRGMSRLSQIPYLIATIMILVGLSVPMLRNIVGAGAAVLFLALALQIQAHRKS